MHLRGVSGTAATAVALATAVLVALPQPAGAADSAAVGFGAGTTGGGNAPAVTVSTLDAFKAAVTGSAAKVVKVNGLIKLSGQVDIGSNTTVLGVGSSSGFTGGGLRLKKVGNVVLRNLTISKAVKTDAITVQTATQVWIDHNSLSSDRDHGKDYYDGLVDITHASDHVTVSWNVFKDHYKGSLVGHSDNNAAEDTGHLRVTYHHNWFDHVNSRTPSLRFGTGTSTTTTSSAPRRPCTPAWARRCSSRTTSSATPRSPSPPAGTATSTDTPSCAAMTSAEPPPRSRGPAASPPRRTATQPNPPPVSSPR